MKLAKAKSYRQIAINYAQEVVEGKKLRAGKEVILACARFLNDLQREDLELHTREPDIVIGIIERTMVHKQGEALDGKPLMNKPFVLQDWQEVTAVYDDVLTLIAETFSEDEIGQQKAVETRREVFCRVGQISRSDPSGSTEGATV